MPQRSHRAPALAMIVLYGLSARWLRAQMVPVSDEGRLSADAASLSQPLYTGPVPVEASAAGGAESPAEPAAVVLPPTRRVRDLPKPSSGDKYRIRPLRAVAFGLTTSTLGGGAEMAMPLASTLNVRVGASYLLYNTPFSIDCIEYNPGIKFVAGRSTLDWFPFHGSFHVSAGALFFQNSIAGSASVPEGQSFTLGGTTYLNSVDDPVHGTAAVTYRKRLAPLVLLGFGNILPRSGRHLSVPIEFGGAYLQPPDIALALAGTACTNQGCFNAGTDPTVQANLAAERSRFSSDLRFLEVYPIVSIGVACRF